MSGELPGVRDLRLHPNEHGRRGGGGWNQGSVAGGEGSASEDVGGSTVSFKDLATLVAVVLDQNDELQGAGMRDRMQGARTPGSTRPRAFRLRASYGACSLLTVQRVQTRVQLPP